MGNTSSKVVELIEKRFSNSTSNFEIKFKNEYLFLKQHVNNEQRLSSSPKKQKKESHINQDDTLHHKLIINPIKFKKRFERFGKWIKMIFPEENEINKSKTYNNNLGENINVSSNTTKITFTKNLKKYYMNNKLKFHNRVSKGPPDSLRWISWSILMNISEDYNNDIVYTTYLNEELNENVDTQIKKDLNRTLNEDNQHNEIITNEHNNTNKQNYIKEQALYNVLRALANIDPVLGYCQGINFIAGFLLKLSEYNETEVYYMLISLFSKSFDTNYHIRGFFIESFPLLYCYLYIFDNILIKELPHLYNHIQYLDVPKMAWIGKWIQTLFTICLPFEMNIRVWDVLLSLDLYFIISFSISLIQSIEKHLMNLKDAFDFTEYLKNFFNSTNISTSQENHSINKGDESLMTYSPKHAMYLEDIIHNAKKKHKVYKSKNYFVNLKQEYTQKVNSLGKYSIYYNLNICSLKFSIGGNVINGLNNSFINYKTHFSEEEKIESSCDESSTHNNIMNNNNDTDKEDNNAKKKKVVYNNMMDNKHNE